ncbi:MAG: hypothetical protein SVX43_05945 [Cyanobacteriota bacterium]|nr:hypothetical protein [Cyanobacteriota bacterium]
MAISPKIIAKITVIASVVLSAIAIPVEAARAAKTIWTVYEIGVPPCDPGAPPSDYPGVGSR